MNEQFIVQRFCDIMRCGELKDEDDDIFNTPGKKYLHEKVIKPIMNRMMLMLGEIDFDAFTENDITEIIDDDETEIIRSFSLLEHIVEKITEAKPLVTKKKIFF